MSATNRVVDWLECIWLADLPSPSKLVAAYLRSYMNAKNQIAFPAVSTISKQTGLSLNTVRKHIHTLEDANWLSVERTNGYKSNRYSITFPDNTLQQLNGSDGENPSAPALDPSAPALDPSAPAPEYTSNIQRINKHWEVFWKCYPNKNEKKKAKERWEKLNPSDELASTIIEHVKARAKSEEWTKDNGRYVFNSAKFLLGERWSDPIKPSKSINLPELIL